MVTILKESKAYQYAVDCVREDNVNVGKYVKKQCQEFLDCVNSDKYYIDERSLKITEGFLQLINIMPNKSAYENLAGFQWFLIVNVLCVKRKSNNKRRYELSIMLIARKNGKTMISSLMFMLLMLLSEPRAEYYSIAPDRELSGQLYKEFVKLIENSPQMSKYFKVLRSEIRCTINNSVYKPLAFSINRLDGRLA
jgi:phage terminase large subunit-like protein